MAAAKVVEGKVAAKAVGRGSAGSVAVTGVQEGDSVAEVRVAGLAVGLARANETACAHARLMCNYAAPFHASWPPAEEVQAAWLVVGLCAKRMRTFVVRARLVQQDRVPERLFRRSCSDKNQQCSGASQSWRNFATSCVRRRRAASESAGRGAPLAHMNLYVQRFASREPKQSPISHRHQIQTSIPFDPNEEQSQRTQARPV